jgi:hypothetical protein
VFIITEAVCECAYIYIKGWFYAVRLQQDCNKEHPGAICENKKGEKEEEGVVA